MDKYNSDYFIAFTVAGEPENVYLKPDKKTSKSGYGAHILAPGRPLFFTNAAPEYIPEGVKENITDVMFGGPGIVVNESIKEFLSNFEIDRLQIYPAVYVDMAGKYHENLWFLNFYSRLDCWDRENFEYDDEELDDDELPSIEKFSLNTQVIDKIPEEQRLAFTMGGLNKAYIFFHKKIAQFILDQSITGIRLIPITEYEEGMEYRPA